MGVVLDPHAHTNRTRNTRVAEPGLPGPQKNRQQGEGQRLTPDAPHSGGRPAPRDGPPPAQQNAAPRRACKPRGQCWAPTPAHPRPQHAGGGPRQPPQRRAARERAPDFRRPSQQRRTTRATRATGGALNAHTSTRTPAREASVRAPPLRPTAPTTHATATGNSHPSPCS